MQQCRKRASPGYAGGQSDTAEGLGAEAGARPTDVSEFNRIAANPNPLGVDDLDRSAVLIKIKDEMVDRDTLIQDN